MAFVVFPNHSIMKDRFNQFHSFIHLQHLFEDKRHQIGACCVFYASSVRPVLSIAEVRNSKAAQSE